MPITVACPSCGSKIHADSELAGKTGRCPKCKTTVSIPTGTEQSEQWWQPASQASAVALSASAPRGRLAGLIALAFAVAAFVMSAAALGIAIVTMTRDPLGAGLSKYDFTTPKAALISQMKLSASGDMRAAIELDAKTNGRRIKEAIETVEIHREATFQGKKILFISLKEDGVNKFLTRGFEKNAETGLWLPSHVSIFSVEKENKPLADQMLKWEESGK